MPDETQVSVGRGEFKFDFGDSPSSSYCDLAIILAHVPADEITVDFDWQVAEDAYPLQERLALENYVRSVFDEFWKNGVPGHFLIEITRASWHAGRRNTPQRAAWVALHDAILDAKLPPLRAFVEPSEEELEQERRKTEEASQRLDAEIREIAIDYVARNSGFAYSEIEQVERDELDRFRVTVRLRNSREEVDRIAPADDSDSQNARREIASPDRLLILSIVDWIVVDEEWVGMDS